MAAKKRTKADRSQAMRKAWQTRRARAALADRASLRLGPAPAPAPQSVPVLLSLDTLQLLQRRLQAAEPAGVGTVTVDLTSAELALLAYALGNLSAPAYQAKANREEMKHGR